MHFFLALFQVRRGVPGEKRGPRREWADGLEEDRLAIWNLEDGFAVETKQ